MSKPTINGRELLAAIPVIDQARAEIVRWYVVVDWGHEYVTVGLPSLDQEGEWAGSGRYTSGLANAVENAISLAAQWSREINEQAHA